MVHRRRVRMIRVLIHGWKCARTIWRTTPLRLLDWPVGARSLPSSRTMRTGSVFSPPRARGIAPRPRLGGGEAPRSADAPRCGRQVAHSDDGPVRYARRGGDARTG